MSLKSKEQHKTSLYARSSVVVRAANVEVVEHVASAQGFALEVEQGLSGSRKYLSSRWLYDEKGSALFSEIMRLPEYYPTRRETEILTRDARRISSCLDKDPAMVVELGAGDGRKTSILLREMLAANNHLEYVPLDISEAALMNLESRMQKELPDLHMRPLAGDNMQLLSHVSRFRQRGQRICLLFLGSSIGNFERAEIPRFLQQLREHLRPGDQVLIGFDLLKGPERLVQAYSDSQGVTAEFNLNLLDRMNRELGASFVRENFRHLATWNPGSDAMESWLVSLCDQSVWIQACGREFRFRKWESIRTEVSLKFEVDELKILASENGFEWMQGFEDEAGDFIDVVWKVKGCYV